MQAFLASSPSRAVAIAFLITAPILWGGNFVVARASSPEMDAVWLNLLRWCLAFCVLLPLAAQGMWAERAALRTSLLPLCVLSALGVVGFNTVLYLALQETSASEAALGFAITPLLIAVFAAIAFRRWPTRHVLLAALLSAAGVWIMQDATGRMFAGSLSVLPASVLWALYSVCLARFALPISALSSFVAQMALGIVGQTLIALASAPIPDFAALCPATFWAIAYLGICAAALAFLLWQKAILTMGPDIAGPFMNLVPVSSLALAFLFLGEYLSARQITGACLIALSLLLTQIAPRRPA